MLGKTVCMAREQTVVRLLDDRLHNAVHDPSLLVSEKRCQNVTSSQNAGDPATAILGSQGWGHTYFPAFRR
jgi:hypothetical protein